MKTLRTFVSIVMLLCCVTAASAQKTKKVSAAQSEVTKDDSLNTHTDQTLYLPQPSDEQENPADTSGKSEPEWKYDPPIDAFLNSEDTLIFTTKFLSLNEEEIHPRSRDYYRLIQNIHELAVWVETPSLLNIRSDLETMSKLIDAINDPAQSPKKDLPEALFDFYVSRANMYFKIRAQIYNYNE